MESESEQLVQNADAQRFPQDGEPVCVICGRYGEYICDKTDEDVCSIECRDRAIERALSRELLASFGITMTGTGVELPIAKEFESLRLPEEVLENVHGEGYRQATPVQMAALPYALNGRDMVVCSPTGTGKSMAFLLPLIVRVMEARFEVEEHRVLGLVITPVRELCMQIETQAKAIMKGIPKMKTALLIGGVPIPNQLHRLNNGVQVIVATPGRLKELMEQFTLELSHVKCCVLDEIDMLLDSGFETQLSAILKQLPVQKQILLTSATVTSDVTAFAQTNLHEPVTLKVKSNQISTSAEDDKSPELILHYMGSAVDSKKRHLFEWLRERTQDHDASIFVFVGSKQGADLLAKSIVKACNIPALSIHGDKTQKQRLEIMESFVEGRAQVLVSTSLLGRGISLIQVTDVVVFDFPSTIEEFIHTIGRAGRGTEDNAHRGSAIVYLTSEDSRYFVDLVPILRMKNVAIPEEILKETTRQRVRARANSARPQTIVEPSKRAFTAVNVDEENQTRQVEKWKQWTHQDQFQHTSSASGATATIEVKESTVQHKKFKFIA